MKRLFYKSSRSRNSSFSIGKKFRELYDKASIPMLPLLEDG